MSRYALESDNAVVGQYVDDKGKSQPLTMGRFKYNTRKACRDSARTGRKVSFSLRAMIEAGVPVATIRKVYDSNN